MAIATTKQFRQAVRQAAGHLLRQYPGNWTDRRTSWSPAGQKIRQNVGYVTFRVRDSATDQDAQNIEDILQKQGVTAQTRLTRTASGTYIRGTCTMDNPKITY